MYTVKLVSWLMHGSLPSYAQDPTWHMLTWTIWTYQYLLHTTTSITPQFTGDNIFPAEHSEQPGKWSGWRYRDPWLVSVAAGLAWAQCWPRPPTQCAALQLLQSSQHSTSGHHSVPSYRYTEFRSPLNSVKISIGYWRGLQVDWGWVAVKMQSTIWISWLDRSVISMLSSTWKSFENVLKKFINEVWSLQ